MDVWGHAIWGISKQWCRTELKATYTLRDVPDGPRWQRHSMWGTERMFVDRLPICWPVHPCHRLSKAMFVGVAILTVLPEGWKERLMLHAAGR